MALRCRAGWKLLGRRRLVVFAAVTLDESDAHEIEKLNHEA